MTSGADDTTSVSDINKQFQRPSHQSIKKAQPTTKRSKIQPNRRRQLQTGTMDVYRRRMAEFFADDVQLQSVHRQHETGYAMQSQFVNFRRHLLQKSAQNNQSPQKQQMTRPSPRPQQTVSK